MPKLPPVPPGNLPRGRPVYVFKTKDVEIEEVFDDDDSPQTSVPTFDDDKEEPVETLPASGSPDTPETARRQMLIQPARQIGSSGPRIASGTRKVKKPGQLPLKLNNTKTTTQGKLNRWKKIDSVKTYELPNWFDAQHHDYHSKEYKTTSCFVQDWLDHPGDSPKDIRARRFVRRLDTEHKDYKPELQKTCEVMYRASFHCSQACCRDVAAEKSAKEKERRRLRTRKAEDSVADDEDSDEDEDEYEEDDEPENPGGSKDTNKGNCIVRLDVEVYSDEPDIAHIWIQNNHRYFKADPAALQYSRQLRRNIVQRSRTVGTTTALIQKWITDFYDSDPVGKTIPDWRKPTAKQIKWMYPALSRVDHLDKDPFRALSIFAERNKENIIMHEAHDPDAEEPTRLKCAMTLQHAKDNMILNSRRHGSTLDGSHRNKNENRAPVHFLSTLNDFDRLVPGFAFLSEDDQARTLADFLRACLKAIMTLVVLNTNSAQDKISG